MQAAKITVHITAVEEDRARAGIKTASQISCRQRAAQRGAQQQLQRGHTATTTAGAHGHNYSEGTRPQPQKRDKPTTKAGAHSHNHSRATQQVKVPKLSDRPT